MLETWKDANTKEPIDPLSDDHTNLLEFLQHTLQHSKNLYRFTLRSRQIAPVNMSKNIVPETVKAFKLELPLTNNELVLLTENQLSNLNTLSMVIGENHEVPLMYKILERFRKQLTTLFLHVLSDDESEDMTINIKLPVMEKVKFFGLSGEEFDLFPEMRHVCPTILPSVTQLSLADHTEPEILHWIQGSQFEHVKKFALSLHSPELDTLTPSVQIVQEIITCFPKIEKLSLTIGFDEMSGLKYLFRNMTSLEKLRLDFDCFGQDYKLMGYNLVSLFLGISLERATDIADNTEKNVTVRVNNPDSIMNLTELKSLTLWAPLSFPFDTTGDVFCTQIITKYGLNKMPKLVKIKFLDGFKNEV